MGYFEKIARSPVRAAMFFASMTLVSFLFALMVELVYQHTASVIIYTIASSIILFVAFYALFRGFIFPLYDNKNDNDEGVNIFAYFFVLATKAIAMSMIYTMMWLWHHNMFHEVNSSLVLGNWLYFIQLGTYLSLGTAAPCIVDTTNPFSSLISSFDIYISKFLEYLAVAVMVDHLRKVTERRNANAKKPKSIL